MYVTHKMTWTVEIDVDFTVKYRPGLPGRMYMRNGDPGYPDEPAEIEMFDLYVNGQKLGGDIAAAFQNALDLHYEDIIAQVEEEAINGTLSSGS